MANLSILNTKIRTQNNFYSLNDLHIASGSQPKHKVANFIRTETTQELIKEISQDSDVSLTIITKHGGKNRGTWVCKELVYAYAMWISPKFHLQVIRAFDNQNSQPIQQALPIPSFQRQRILVVVENGETIATQLLNDDEFVINRNNFAYQLRDPELFNESQLKRALSGIAQRLDS